MEDKIVLLKHLNQWMCKTCLKIFKWKSSAIRHVKSIHPAYPGLHNAITYERSSADDDGDASDDDEQNSDASSSPIAQVPPNPPEVRDTSLEMACQGKSESQDIDGTLSDLLCFDERWDGINRLLQQIDDCQKRPSCSSQTLAPDAGDNQPEGNLQ